MVLALGYALLGAILGLSVAVIYGFLQGGELETLYNYGEKGLLVGLILGLVVAVWQGIFGRPRMVFDYKRKVVYELAPCAWCHGKGINLLIFRCRVCGGRGHVLAVTPRKKCAWCLGRGKRYIVFRCSVCDGTGWAYGHRDRK